MKITVEMDQAQLDDLRDRLAFIKGGWEQTVVRAMNYGASQARSKTAERSRSVLTADRERIEASLLVKKASYGARSARLHIYDLPIPLFRFDVSFMYEHNLLTPMDLPPNIYPSAAYSNLPVPIALDAYGNVVIGSWGSGSSAILSTDKGATWSLLKWGEGAELETPSCLLVSPGGFLSNNAFRRDYSWSATGQIPWTYFSMPFNSSWGNISKFAWFNGAVFASFNYGSVGSLAILRSTDPGHNQWEVADPGTLTIGWSDNYEPFLLDLGDRLLCLSCQGLYRTSVDGLVWSDGFSTLIKTDGSYLRDAVTGNGWVVAIDTSGQPRVYAVRTTDLVFSVYSLPVDTQPRALAFGGGRFCLTGTGGHGHHLCHPR
jgi:hypothetical protein